MSYLSKIGGIRPSAADGPALVSFDVETYGNYISQQVPAIAVTGDYLWRVNYGKIGIEVGQTGETAPAYTRLSRAPLSDLDTWTHIAFFLPRISSESIIDPQVTRLLDGKLLVLYAYAGGIRRSAWGVVLNNPLADSGFSFGSARFLDFGIPGRPRNHNGEMRFSCSEPLIGQSPPYDSWRENKYCRLVSRGDWMRCERISAIPIASAALNDFPECSVNRIGANGALAMFRTQQRHYTAKSSNGGLSWGAAQEFTALNTASTRSDMARSPSGRLWLAFNNSTAKRENMAVAGSDDDGVTWPYVYTFDPRGNVQPSISYPSIDFDAAGNIYVGYDRGRGRLDPPTYTNEIIVAKMSEAAIVAGNPSVSLHAVTS